MLIVKLAWVTLIGLVSNAVAEVGLPQLFSSTRAEWTSALSSTPRGKRCCQPISYSTQMVSKLNKKDTKRTKNIMSWSSALGNGKS